MISLRVNWVNTMIDDFSVLMAVHSKDSHIFLDEAIQSIYDNQILKPKEIILVRDGPLGIELEYIINNWTLKIGEIFRVFSLSENMGLAYALNFGLKECKYDIVARMDADDLSLPERFLKQVKFIRENSDISVVGSIIEEVDVDLRKSFGFRKVPLFHSDFYSFLKTRNPFSHPSVIFRKAHVLAVGGYPVFKKAQDYALWSLLYVKEYKFANIDECLLRMRTGEDMMKRRGLDYFKHEIKILNFQLKIGLINRYQYIVNYMVRFIIRAQPIFIKSFIYKLIKDNK